MTTQELITVQHANQANAATGVYGPSGSGKSALADTAAEYAWETFEARTLAYVADLGGFGNKRLTLIRAGIMSVWDPRNHINPFETMEAMSLGAWPERILDPERGYAAPDVKLIYPLRDQFVLVCPNGHEAGRFDNMALLAATQPACPTCGQITNPANCLRIDRLTVKPRLFKGVGLRIYDSFTALNDWGMSDLQRQSAHGLLPTSGSGGSALGGADALVSGTQKFSTGSKAQYGFLQNRTYGWLANIKTIPDAVVPAICTFLVEQSKADEDSGGQMVYGPKIAGQAATGRSAAWVGNLLHASKEPLDGTTLDSQGMPVMVHRLWLTTHIDPRDASRTPYLAKHRGTPVGMPDYLQDPWSDDKAARERNAWSVCSLAVLFNLLQQQLTALDAATRAKYPNAPAYAHAGDGEGAGDPANADEIADEVVSTTMVRSGSGTGVAGGAVAATGAAPAPARRGLRKVGAVAASTAPAVVYSTPPVAVAAPATSTAPVSVGTDGVAAKESTVTGAGTGVVGASVADPGTSGTVQAPHSAGTPAPSTAGGGGSTAVGPRPLRRVARPPVG